MLQEWIELEHLIRVRNFPKSTLLFLHRSQGTLGSLGKISYLVYYHMFKMVWVLLEDNEQG